jgi:hypoxanthine phosphoribosyltransferase
MSEKPEPTPRQTAPALRPIISQERIERRLDELAARIRADYEGKDLTIVAVMKGAVFFLVDLLRRVEMPVRLDVVHVSSYAGAASTGAVRVLNGMTLDIRGGDVLIVDDILDTGLTLSHVIDDLTKRGPRSVKTCVLLSKKAARRVELKPDYCGFGIADEYVVGYGLDYNDRYRHLPYIAAIEQQAE